MTVIDELWAEWKRIIKPNGAIAMTASQPFISKLVMSNLKMFKYEWIWNKRQSGDPFLVNKQPLKVHENIIVFGGTAYNPQMTKGKMRKKGGARIENVKIFGATAPKMSDEYYPKSILGINNCSSKINKVHPTQKLVALFEYLIRTYTNEGDTVFDGFSGSGTTAIACHNLKRNFICIEKDYDYWYASMERLKTQTQQTSLF